MSLHSSDQHHDLNDMEEQGLLRLEKVPPATTIFRKLACSLRPTFTRQTLSLNPKQGLRYTSALDGLRGLAAFGVFNYHWLLVWTDANRGYQPARPQYSLVVGLPFLKVFSNGLANVGIFFVISGYVLSHKSLKLMRTEDWEKSHQVLTSSIFRRFMRLYIPSLLWLLICAILFWLGVNEPGRQNIVRGWLGSYWYPPQQPTLGTALHTFFWTVVRLTNPWNWDEWLPIELDANHWTIRVEFMVSMVLFIVILGTSRVKRSIRLALVSAIIVWAAIGTRDSVVLFLIGYLLADFDVEADFKNTPRFSRPKNSFRHDMIWGSAVTFAVYLLSYPKFDAYVTIGYSLPASIVATLFPTLDFWVPFFIGAAIMVYATTNYSPVNRFFSSHLLQYLGKISFAFYLCHGTILRIIAYNIVPVFLDIFGTQRDNWNFSYFFSIFIGYIVCLIILVPVADIYTTWVTEPALEIGKWVEKKCFVS